MNKSLNYLLIGFLIIFLLIARLWISIPGATPLFAICILTAHMFNARIAVLVTCACLLVSDLGLSLVNGYPLIGSWMLFTYSGMAAVCLLMYVLRKQSLTWIIIINPFATTAFWAWTNLDPYFFTYMYPHTLQGFGQCYFMALPFLKNALWGNLLWSGVALYPTMLLKSKATQPV